LVQSCEGHYHYLRLKGDPFNEENVWDNEDIDFTSSAGLLDALDFGIGDAVVVKVGVKGPDTGYDIDGWQGRIMAIIEEDDEDLFVTIEWDSQTLNNISVGIFQQCVKEEPTGL
jgi:hypothetical protein